ncbi:hypothetical protein D3C84_1045190 [compost metagenome]
MLQHTRPCDRAFLRNVSNENGRDAFDLRNAHEVRRALPYLRNAARRGLHIRIVHRLTRIDHEKVRLDRLDCIIDVIHIRFTQHEQHFRQRPETICS